MLPATIVFLFATLLGCLQCKVLVPKFDYLCSVEHYFPKLYDFLSYVLVGDNVGHIFYLSKTDMGLMFQPLSFLIFGFFIAGFNFLVKPKGYYQFVYARNEKERTFVNRIYKEQLSLIVIYCVTYYVVVLFCGLLSGYEIGEWERILTAVLLGMVSKIIFFAVLKAIVLYCFLRRGVTDTIMAGIVLVALLLMLDVAVECKGVNLLLFSDGLNVPGMLGLALLGIVTHGFNQKIDLLKLD